MAHGYYNLKGDFVKTDTREDATAAWRAERGYQPLGVFDVGGGELLIRRRLQKRYTKRQSQRQLRQPLRLRMTFREYSL